MSNTNSLISVIITTFNRNEYLETMLSSIQNQTYENIEILLIDDGSKPEIANLNKSIATKFSKCTYYYKQNSGQPDSRNFGIKKAKGVYIGFCDDDDYWVLNKLEKQINILYINPDYDIVTGDIQYVDKDGKLLNAIKSHKGFNHGTIFENLLEKNRTSSITPLLRKKVFEKAGLFNPKFTLAEDWDFWRRASFYHKFYSQNEIMAYVRIHDNNMTYKQRSAYDTVFLYRKLTKELLIWGKNKFTKKQLKLIYKYERQKYQRIISNNYNTKFKQLLFLVKFLIKNPFDGLHILSLFTIKLKK